MSNIQNALGNLWEAVEKLETAADDQEQRFLKLKQQDMFNGENNKNITQPSLIAEKLNIAIAKVEEVLGKEEVNG